jgi:hypothetical protein
MILKGIPTKEYADLLESISINNPFHAKRGEDIRVKYVECSYHTPSREIWRVKIMSNRGVYEFATNSLVPFYVDPNQTLLEELKEKQYSSIINFIHLFLNDSLDVRFRHLFEKK